MKKDNIKFQNLDDSLEPIKMDQMTQVISIPFIGILLGGTLLIIEVIFTKNPLRKQKTSKNVHSRKKQFKSVSALPNRELRQIIQQPLTAPVRRKMI